MFNFPRLTRKERIEIDVLDVPEFIASRLSSTASDERRKLKASLEEVKKEFYSLKILMSELGGKNVNHAFSNTVKNNYVSKSGKIIDNVVFEIERNIGISYTGTKNCLAATQTALDEISSLKMKELRHLYAFKSDMDKASNQVKSIMKKHKELQDLFNSCNILAEIDSIERLSGSVQNDIVGINSLNIEISVLNDKALELERMAEAEKQKRGGMEKEEKALELAEHEARRLEKEKSSIRQRFATEFGGIERVLKKYVHSGAEISKEELELAEQYVKSPEDAFIGDKNLLIKKILYEIISLNVLDRKEKEKASDMIRSASILVSMRNEYAELAKKSDEFKENEKFVEIASRRREHKERLQETEKNLSVVNSDLDRKIHEKTKLEMNVMKTRKALETALSRITEKEIVIKLD